MPFEFEQQWDYSYRLPEPVVFGEWMGFFYIYADESGKGYQAATDYTALCGFIGAALEVQRVSYEWSLCQTKWNVPPIHMSQIMAETPKDKQWIDKRTEWGTRWEELRDTMLDDFAFVIQQSKLVAVGIVIDASKYREIQSNPAIRLPVRDSNVYLFQELIMSALERIEVVDDCSPVSVVVDDDQDTAFDYYTMLKSLKSNQLPAFDKIRKRVHGLCFCNDRAYPILQAADMIAHEARSLMVRRISDPAVPPSQRYQRLTQGGINQPKLYTGETLLKVATETARRVKEQQNAEGQER
jgi:hypothetical protein